MADSEIKPVNQPDDPFTGSTAVNSSLGATATDAVDAIVVEALTPAIPGPGLLAAVGWTVLLLLVQIGVSVVAAVPLILFGASPDTMAVVFVPVNTAATLLLAIALTLALFRSRTRAVLALRRPNACQALVAALAVFPLGFVAGEIHACVAEVLPSFSQGTFKGLSQAPYMYLFVVGCLVPAVGEEMFFRGFLGRGLVARYGVWVGILLTTLMFGLFHIDPAQAVGVLVFGLAFQGLFLATKSLLTPMLAHMLNNATSFAVMKYHGSSEEIDHWPILLVAAAAVALIAIGILFYQMRSRWICSDGSEWLPGYVTAEEPPASISAACRAERPSVRCWAAAIAAYAAFLGVAVWAL